MHTIVLPTRKSDHDLSLYEAKNQENANYLKSALTQFIIPRSQTFNLLKEEVKGHSLKPVTHIVSKFGVMICTDKLHVPHSNVPFEMIKYMKINRHRQFLPIVVEDSLQQQMKDLKEITKNTVQTNFELNYAPISIGKLKFMVQMEVTFNNFINLGFTAKDMDEMKGVFADTNLYLLCATILIGSIHVCIFHYHTLTTYYYHI